MFHTEYVFEAEKEAQAHLQACMWHLRPTETLTAIGYCNIISFICNDSFVQPFHFGMRRQGWLCPQNASGANDPAGMSTWGCSFEDFYCITCSHGWSLRKGEPTDNSSLVQGLKGGQRIAFAKKCNKKPRTLTVQHTAEIRQEFWHLPYIIPALQTVTGILLQKTAIDRPKHICSQGKKPPVICYE